MSVVAGTQPPQLTVRFEDFCFVLHAVFLAQITPDARSFPASFNVVVIR